MARDTLIGAEHENEEAIERQDGGSRPSAARIPFENL